MLRTLSRGWIVAAILLITNSIALDWLVTRPHKFNLDEYVTSVSEAMHQENTSLQALFNDPPGMFRDADIQKLHDAEQTVYRDTQCTIMRRSPGESDDEYAEAISDNFTIDLPCTIARSKILSYFKYAQLRFEIVMFDAQYIADHCAVSGRVDGAQNQFTCDRSLNTSDARFTNANEDLEKFVESLQSAEAEGRREISLADSPVVGTNGGVVVGTP